LRDSSRPRWFLPTSPDLAPNSEFHARTGDHGLRGHDIMSRFAVGEFAVACSTQPGVESVVLNADFVRDIAGSASFDLNEVYGIELHFVGVLAEVHPCPYRDRYCGLFLPH
jgi:hypothetical protein